MVVIPSKNIYCSNELVGKKVPQIKDGKTLGVG